MEGYGEFYWQDGKVFKGYFHKDKKEGFGIYQWRDPLKICIGFWKKGKQHGVGKFFTAKDIKWGLWDSGELVKWYESEYEAVQSLGSKLYKKYFLYFCLGLTDLSREMIKVI